MKHIFQGSCPCSNIEFKLIYIAEDVIDLFCPFCGASLEHDDNPLDDDEEEIED